MMIPLTTCRQPAPSRRSLLALTLILLATFAGITDMWAADAVTLDKVELLPGRATQVAIHLNNETAYTAFQMDISLPQGVTLAQTDGTAGISLSSRATAHNLTTKTLKDGTIRVLAYSMQNQTITVGSGDLLLLTLTADATFQGSETIKLKKIRFTTTAIKEVKFPNVSAICERIPVIPGDANGDGRVTITDAVYIVNYVLQQPAPDFIPAAADLNGDGNITITDAVMVVNIILGQTQQ